VVVFAKSQTLPRYIVHYRKTRPTLVWLDDNPEGNRKQVQWLERMALKCIKSNPDPSLSRGLQTILKRAIIQPTHSDSSPIDSCS
jgi:hypothetical protein